MLHGKQTHICCYMVPVDSKNVYENPMVQHPNVILKALSHPVFLVKHLDVVT